jgi:hypothetical protein
MAQITLNSTGVASNGSLVLQSNGTTAAVTVDTSQNVGIGTSSPTQKLSIGFADASSGFLEFRSSSYAKLAQIEGADDNAGGNGHLSFYTRNVGTIAERARIDASGNLGVGTTSPQAKLDVQGALAISNSSASYWKLDRNDSDGSLQFIDTATERARIDTSGNFLVGTTSQAPLVGGGRYITLYNTSNTTLSVQAVDSGNDRNATFELLSSGAGGSISQFVYGDTRTVSSTQSPLVFASYYNSTRTERMRLDPSGNLCVGNTNTAPGSGNTVTGCTLDGGLGIGYFSRSSDSSLIINTNANGKVSRIYRSGSEVGDITVTTTTTSFNSTSDYRLKTVLGAVADSGSRIDALEPIEYTWNSNGTRTRGFLAHQFQEVYANSVAGTKDAIDANGNPEYQSMQAGSSEVIADLVAEIQSLRKRLAAAGI